MLPFRFAPSIKWLRLKLTPSDDGGAVVNVVAGDESPELAQQNAANLEQNISAISRINLGLLGALLGKTETRFIETVRFDSRGKQIHGELTVTAAQLGSVLDLLSQIMTGMVQRAANRARELETLQDAAPTPALGSEDARPAPDPLPMLEAGAPLP